ncbi:MAG TPA: hypothetical protein VJP07_04595 [Dehalococcoidia bacterium]|nr:hypothetical protein [Dehalococcoidia bacterium]
MPRKPAGASRPMFSPAIDDEVHAGAPLAARMRPRSFDEYVGQEHVVGEGRMLRLLVDPALLPVLHPRQQPIKTPVQRS